MADEYIGYDEATGTPRSHIFDNEERILEYTWEVEGDRLTIWAGDAGADAVSRRDLQSEEMGGSLMGSVLVAYATKYGSTREVAEAVAVTLAEHALQTEVRPARDVASVDGYSAVVLGGALYYFMWHRGARQFLRRHRKALTGMPVATFALGPFGEDAPQELADARKPMDRVLAKHEWLRPVSTAVFGGRFDPTLLRFPDANQAMKKISPSDARDWDAIRVWAAALPEAFGLREPAAGE